MAGVSGSAALVVAATLAVSAVSKARSLRVFSEQIADYRLVPYSLTGTVAIGIVAWEGAVAGLLVLPTTRHVAALGAAALFGLFLAVLVLAWKQGRDINCGCFGGSGDLDNIGLHAAVRTALLLVLAGLAASAASMRLGLLEIVGAGLLAACVFLLAELSRLLSDLRRHSHEIARSMIPRSSRLAGGE